MAVTFNTSVPDPETGVLVLNRDIIARIYLKRWFAVDFMSTFPFEELAELVFHAEGPLKSALSSLVMLRQLRLVRLIKLARIAKTSSLFDGAEKLIGALALRWLKLVSVSVNEP